MPYKFQTENIKMPRNKDRRIKLLDCQKRMIPIMYATRLFSQRSLARAFGVSRRLISFILNPKQHEANKELFKARQKERRYYDREKNTKATREHRRYKKKVLDELNKDL